MADLAALNANALARNRLSDRGLNAGVQRLRQRLQQPKKIRRGQSARRARRPAKRSNQVDTFGVVYTILAVVLIGFIMYFTWNFVKTHLTPAAQPVQPAQPARVRPRAGIPSTMGVPISVEEGGDISENRFLNLYGSPTAPGFASDPYGIAPGYQPSWKYKHPSSGYTPWGSGAVNATFPPVDSNPPYTNVASYPDGTQTLTPNDILDTSQADYYQGAETASVARDQLNQYVAEQNQQVRAINARVAQINRKRMFSPEFMRHKSELREVRNIERRLANRVYTEAQDQPDLPDVNMSN